jgi:N4-(beta-N-acetylglucosaminyl)-L-asparaginase
VKFSRREFLATATATSATAAFGLNTNNGQAAPQQKSQASSSSGGKNVIVCALNGYELRGKPLDYLDRGWAILSKGGDTLDAALAVVRGPEDDPNDDSVGYGGLPNEDGVVELDSCLVHGPTGTMGSVGGVRNIKNVSQLANAVRQHTGHVMLVGEGAERFGYAMGFQKENLLTERSRKIWLLWKETHSNQDWWGPGLDNPKWTPPAELEKKTSEVWRERYRKLKEIAADLGIEPEYRALAIERVLHPPTGTINCSACNEKGEISSVTTTSGLAWKLPGRCGDSPVLGAGCWADQDVGAAGATGNGEENIKVAGAHTIVENMRKGMSPADAGLDALKRIARNFNNDMTRLRYVSMFFYVLRKDGAHAGCSLWSKTSSGQGPRQYGVHDGTKHAETAAHLFEGTPVEWPPTPKLPRES